MLPVNSEADLSIHLPLAAPMEMDAIEDNGDEMDEMEAFFCIFGEHQDEESDQDSKEELEVAQAIIEAQTIIPEVFVSALQEKSRRHTTNS